MIQEFEIRIQGKKKKKKVFWYGTFFVIFILQNTNFPNVEYVFSKNTLKFPTQRVLTGLIHSYKSSRCVNRILYKPGG